MKNWKCTVCGYLHAGNQPLSKCPVCAADQDKFVPAPEGDKPESKAPSASPLPGQEQPVQIPLIGTRFRGLLALLIRKHLHPILSHIPNGVLPLSVLFILLAALFDWQALGRAAMFNMLFVLLALPGVLFTGYLEWKLKYGGHWTWLFRLKIGSALCTLVLVLVLAIWLALNPGILAASGGGRVVFVLLSLVMLAAAGTAGYLGGKLVFKD
ncbi:MAG: rubredoxin-like domain-containing protein [Desulfohalobiaceae bacterium]